MGAARPHWRLRRCVSRTGFCIQPSLGRKRPPCRSGSRTANPRSPDGERGMGAARPHWRLRRCVSRTGFCIQPSLGRKIPLCRSGSRTANPRSAGGERGMGAARPHWRLRRCVSRTGFCIQPSLGRKTKRPREGVLLFSGGERGIRTLEGLLTLTPLAGERFRPLSHLSRIQIVCEPGARSALTRAIPGARPSGGSAVQIGLPADLSTTQPSLQNSNCMRARREERSDTAAFRRKPGTACIRQAAHTTQTIGPGKA